MTNSIPTLVRGDDGAFLNQIFLVVHFKTNLTLDGYKMRLTIENPTNFIKTYEVVNNAVEVNLTSSLSSSLEVATHRCNVKLIDTLNNIKTVKDFEIKIEDEFDTTYVYPNEYELEVVLDDGINKYKNYNELSNQPSIQGVTLTGDKSFQDLGMDEFTFGILNKGISDHNTSETAHQDIRDEIMNKQDRLIAGSNITIIDGIISSLGAEGGVTTNYKDLGNKPKINGVVLDDDKTFDDLGLDLSTYATKTYVDEAGYLKEVPSGYITEEELEAYNYLQEVPDTYKTDEENKEIYFTIEDASNKQDKLTAGTNIDITDNTISANIPDEYITEDELTAKKYVNTTDLGTLLTKKQNRLLAGDNITFYTNIDGSVTISALDSKSTKTITSYNALSNKPQINSVELTGNKSLSELGIQPKGDYQTVLTAGDNIEIEVDENNNTVISSIIPDDICTDGELQTGLATKADKGTTLSEYGITDAFTKTEIRTAIIDSFKTKVSDIIIDAPNGVANYTETSFTIKDKLNILYANGLLYKLYNNYEVILDGDIEVDLSSLEYTDDLAEYYLALSYANNVYTPILLPKKDLTILNVNVIPNTLTGYVKNLYTNKYYKMVYKDNGIYTPTEILFKVLGEGTIVSNDGKIKITSFVPYGVYRLFNQDEFDLYTNKLQDKLTFGNNFLVEDNKVDYIIPTNYVTKEYLIENNFTTQTDVNDRVNIHNTNSTSHEDIRTEISNLWNKNYVTPAQLNSAISALTTRLNDLESRVEKLERK